MAESPVSLCSVTEAGPFFALTPEAAQGTVTLKALRARASGGGDRSQAPPFAGRTNFGFPVVMRKSTGLPEAERSRLGFERLVMPTLARLCGHGGEGGENLPLAPPLPVCSVRFVTIDGQVCGRLKASAPRLWSPSSHPAGCGP